MNLNVLRCAIFVSGLLALSGGSAAAQTPGWEWQSELSAGLRWFTNPASDPRQDRTDLTVSGQIEGFRDFGRHRLAITARSRWDDRDSARHLVDLSELYWRRRFDGGEV
ncbi:MAG: hypothetical protein AAFN07_09030, partial [Pseudomonadota bacterium]